MLKKISSLLIIIIFLSLTAFSYPRLQFSSNQLKAQINQDLLEVLLFPNGQATEAIAFDYKTVLANVLWFNTVNYFGKHYRGDRSYKWLSHMCDLVTELDKKAEHVYQFCSLMLAWEAEQPQLTQKLLDKAIKYNPDSWRYYYFRGVNEAIFMKAPEAAQKDFAAGAALPNSPIFMTRLASKMLSGISSPQAAIGFLKGLLSKATNESEKQALQKHLNSSVHDYNIDRLEVFVKDAISRLGNQDIVLEKVIPNFTDFIDPYGGQYYYDSASKSVKSTSGVARAKSLVSNIKSNK